MMLTSASAFSQAPIRWPKLPLPPEPQVRMPGCALACDMKSVKFLKGELGSAQITNGAFTMAATGAISDILNGMSG